MTKDAEITEVAGRSICPAECHVLCQECTRIVHEVIRGLRTSGVIVCKPGAPGYEGALAAAVNSYDRYIALHGNSERIKLEAMNYALTALHRVTKGVGV